MTDAEPKLMMIATADLFTTWLTLETILDRLTIQWQELETWLIDHAPGFDLDDPLACGLRQAKELVELNGDIEELLEARRTLLGFLTGFEASDLQGIIGQLKVASRLLRRADAPEAHDLVVLATTALETLAVRMTARPQTD